MAEDRSNSVIACAGGMAIFLGWPIQKFAQWAGVVEYYWTLPTMMLALCLSWLLVRKR